MWKQWESLGAIRTAIAVAGQFGDERVCTMRSGSLLLEKLLTRGHATSRESRAEQRALAQRAKQ